LDKFKESGFWNIYFLISSFFIIVFIIISYLEWLSNKNKFVQELSYLNKITAQNTLSSLRFQESTLKILGKYLLNIDAQSNPEAGRIVIEEMISINKGLVAFGLARYDGQLILVSGLPKGRKLPNLMKNKKTSASFNLARNSTSMQIGRTYYMKTLQKWVIPVRVAITNENDETPLVMTAGIQIDGGSTALNVKEIPNNTLIQELRSDGYIQFQNPIKESDYKTVYNKKVNDKTIQKIKNSDHDSLLVLDTQINNKKNLSVVTFLEEFNFYTVASMPYKEVNEQYFNKLYVTTSLLILLLMTLFFIFKHTIGLQEKSRNKIINFNKELKQKVQVRTSELEETNDELEQTITNLKNTQYKLIESEKMASLGGLVAGVAHEINTPIGIGLTGITHFIDLNNNIKTDYENKNVSEEDFKNFLDTSANLADQIHSNLERTAHLVRSFKQVAVDQTDEKRRLFNFNEYIHEILMSLTSIIKKTNLKIIVTCDSDLEIQSYPGAFSQIFTNLIINSINHAYSPKQRGEITIKVLIENSELHIAYHDDGKGIQDKELSKIFDPFYTTNRENGGTGLGLNVIYNIVTHMLNGSLICTSQLDKGTTFTIKIPLNENKLNANIHYEI